MNRREFARLAGGTALLAPAGIGILETPAAGAAPPQQRPDSALKLTAEQSEQVERARQRALRRMRGLRPQPIPYDAEPAFVFRARAAARPKA